MDRIVEALLGSPEPAIRWRVRARVLREPPDEPAMASLRREVRDSPLVQRLLAPFRGGDWPPVYAKWQGSHWVLSALADVGYPPGDASLVPLREQVLGAWLRPECVHDVPVIKDRHRAHASQQGNALWSLATLGLADERSEKLMNLLLGWQWPDGGWNCDRDPTAHVSSFNETLFAMRGLWAHGTPASREAARRAAGVFLARRLAYRARTGEVIRDAFLDLHHPLYWHYDVLGGLVAMGELGLLGDPRCADALDLLESMRLPDGWPARARYFRPSANVAPHNDWVDWGGTSARRANPWVTADALAVLRAAGRLEA